MKIVLGNIVLACCCYLLATTTSAQSTDDTRYVIGRVVLTMRAEPAPGAAIVERLTTGDEMRLLGDENPPFVKIELPNGTQGWVDGGFITPIPIVSSDEAQALAEENLSLRADLDETRGVLSDAEASIIRLSEDMNRLNLELGQLRESTTQPSEFEAIIEKLKANSRQMRQELEQTQRKNKELAETDDWRWYAIGAATLAAGALLGYLISLFGRRRSPFY